MKKSTECRNLSMYDKMKKIVEQNRYICESLQNGKSIEDLQKEGYKFGNPIKDN